VRVQGPTAARGISRAISALAARRDLDAIVIIRGGGARNELATFVVSGGNGTGVHENVDGVNTDARIQVGKKLGNPLGGVRKPLAL
jgi:enhancing lycopene biosynthesis protein 2